MRALRGVQRFESNQYPKHKKNEQRVRKKYEHATKHTAVSATARRGPWPWPGRRSPVNTVADSIGYALLLSHYTHTILYRIALATSLYGLYIRGHGALGPRVGLAGTEPTCRDFTFRGPRALHALHLTYKHPYAAHVGGRGDEVGL